MKDTYFTALLIASKPKEHLSDKVFTDKVMRSLTSTEILSSAIRNMDVTKKETFMKRIKRLPAFMLVAIVVGAALLLSGSAYAAYQLLWQKPEVHVSEPTKSVSGRDEVAITLQQCEDRTLAARYELKRNATITADQVAGVAEARCELAAIDTWAQSEFGNGKNSRFTRMPNTKEPYNSEHVSTSMATHIQSRDASSVTFVGLTKYNQSDKAFTNTENVRYFADGKEVKSGDIADSDPVVYVTRYRERMTPAPGCDEKHCSISGALLGEDLLAIVKLNLSFENYDQFAWQSLTERTTCTGNPNDSCLTGFIGGIDLYYGPASVDLEKNMMKEIQGTVTQLNGKSIVIKSSSGSLFTLITPSDVVSTYNTTKAGRYYNNQTVEVGSTLRVSYTESADQHTKTLTSDMLMSVLLQTEGVGKSDAPTAY